VSERVLIAAPIGRDATLTQSAITKAGLAAKVCPDLTVLAEELKHGAGALLIADEGLRLPGQDALEAVLAGEPPWSAVPVVVLTRGPRVDRAAFAALQPLRLYRPVTFLSRPVRVMTLVSTLRVAIDARRRQYQMRELLERLERAVRNRDEFLAMFGHEIRNPLGAVVSALDLLHLLPEHDARADRAIEIVDRQARHLVQLTDDLLDVSRVTRGKVTLRTLPTSIATTVADVMDDIVARARQRDIAVEVPAIDGALVVDADPLRLRQILQNVLGNAVKYTPPGGRVRVDVEADAATVALRIRDTGAGMAPEILESVFDMFVQGNHSLARSEGGLGIGLTLARALVELHGGTITAASEGPGQGSEFTVTLPRSRAGDDGVPAPETAMACPSGLRVLLVDDNEDLIEALGALLERWGCEVHLAYDGESAIEAARRVQPHAIFLDIGLPKLDGYAVARRLRAQPQFRTTPLIALTGYGQESDRRNVAEAGFDRHLIKPVAVSTLQHVLADVYA